ncbi:MAG: response regulator [Cyanobacteria bacterium P01_A01_bin.123]
MKLTELTDLLAPPDKRFNGHLMIEGDQTTWTLNFVQGQLMYAVDEHHAVRRWHRLLKKYFPNWQWQIDPLQTVDLQSWQVHLLDQGINQQKLSLIRVKLVVRMIAQECLFELSPCTNFKHNWQPSPMPISLSYQSVGLSGWEIQMTLNRVNHLRQQWQDAGLEQLSPMLAPTLNNPAAAHSLPIDRQYLSGDFTLWDIAGQLDKSVTDIAQSLMPLTEQGILVLKTIPDLVLKSPLVSVPPAPTGAPPVSTQATQPTAPRSAAPQSAAQATPQAPPPGPPTSPLQSLIACIDDSPVLAYSLKKTLVSAGYRVLTIQEPMRGFSQLIEHKPNLILLDLLLPNADGYSVCKFLRDTPVFEKIPIIILTGQNTPIDRARARMAGATEFLAKPPLPQTLLDMIQKHLVRP